jgi:hypothetical protein
MTGKFCEAGTPGSYGRKNTRIDQDSPDRFKISDG